MAEAPLFVEAGSGIDPSPRQRQVPLCEQREVGALPASSQSSDAEGRHESEGVRGMR